MFEPGDQVEVLRDGEWWPAVVYWHRYRLVRAGRSRDWTPLLYLQEHVRPARQSSPVA